MIGAAFYRENYKKGIYGETVVDGNEMKSRISKDLLNPLAFSIATTDMFYRFKNMTMENIFTLKIEVGFLKKI